MCILGSNEKALINKIITTATEAKETFTGYDIAQRAREHSEAKKTMDLRSSGVSSYVRECFNTKRPVMKDYAIMNASSEKNSPLVFFPILKTSKVLVDTIAKVEAGTLKDVSQDYEGPEQEGHLDPDKYHFGNEHETDFRARAERFKGWAMTHLSNGPFFFKVNPSAASSKYAKVVRTAMTSPPAAQ